MRFAESDEGAQEPQEDIGAPDPPEGQEDSPTAGYGDVTEPAEPFGPELNRAKKFVGAEDGGKVSILALKKELGVTHSEAKRNRIRYTRFTLNPVSPSSRFLPRHPSLQIPSRF